VRDELNVRELRFVSEADELGEVEVKANYRTLGPRFGKQMPMVAAAIAGLDGRTRGQRAARRRQDWDLGRRQRSRRSVPTIC
jgi:isoleucyl-tRNA synthetase